MRKVACAGAVALAAVGAALISMSGTAHCAENIQIVRTDARLSDAAIAQIKDKLRLTAEQERLWSPFAAALRDVVRHRARHNQLARHDDMGTMQRAAQRAGAFAGGAANYKRLASAAAPLIKSFDDMQRREAMMMARAMGFEHLAAAF
jgi:zinc resistance-associated protein